MSKGILAIVGRPNVGKSTVFNRLIGERKSIVEDTPGVTRDRIYGKVEWLTREFQLIDTGGIQIENQPFQQEIKMQVEIAIDEADCILFLVNGRDGVTADDHFIADLSGKPVHHMGLLGIYAPQDPDRPRFLLFLFFNLFIIRKFCQRMDQCLHLLFSLLRRRFLVISVHCS